MAARIDAASAPADRVLVIERLLDAPRSLVFSAWTNSDHLMHWLAPRGYTAVRCQTDARVGGELRFVMRSPEGNDIHLKWNFRELIEPEKIVCAHVWMNAEGNPTQPETLLTVTFAEENGKTRITLRQEVFETVTIC